MATLFGDLVSDFRLAARLLRKDRAFTVVAVGILAVAIGGNATLFVITDGLERRGLPVDAPDRMTALGAEDSAGRPLGLSIADLDDVRSADAFAGVAAYAGAGANITERDLAADRVSGAFISGNTFALLGERAIVGREFAPEDDRTGAPPVCIIGYAIWQERYGASSRIVGRTIAVNGVPTTIVGVMRKGFRYPLVHDLWLPLASMPGLDSQKREARNFQVLGRLAAGVSLAHAQAELDTIAARLAREYPATNDKIRFVVRPFTGGFELNNPWTAMLGAVSLVLVIACANVANLLLARATERQREMAIRAALGASRGRIMRQLLTESVTLSMLGAGLGLLLSAWGTELLTALSPATMFKLQEVRMDGRVLGFTLAISILTGLLFGLAPALHAARPEVQLALSEGGRGSSGKGQRRLRGLLVVTEVALALVLLIGAGLLVRSFTRLLDVTPGFESGNLLTMMVPANGPRYEKDEQVRAFYQEAIKRIERLPGVEAAGIVSNLPLGGNMDKSGLHIEEKPLANPADAPSAERYSISPDYLRAMRIPVLRGRGFTDQDGANAPLVALINQTLARQVWPNEDPIGKRIRLGSIENPLRTIVGVVGDVNHYGLDTPPDLQAYVPHAQWTDSYMLFAVRTANDPTAIADAARREVWSVDKDIPVYQVATMERLVASSVAQRRFTLVLLGVFAGVALLVAAIGIYSVMSYSVTNRTNEIGIRMALGAGAGDVFRLVVGQGMKLAAAGVATGLIAAFALTRLMTGLLFGVSASDPLTFAGVGLLLALVAFVACWIPARRATKVDPMTALRCE
ncbi:MAG TPA: ABC transporter permease [Blastocatellia bacterium]|nr:ABC transporter permease [Blastocatellia bacterium]